MLMSKKPDHLFMSLITGIVLGWAMIEPRNVSASDQVAVSPSGRFVINEANRDEWGAPRFLIDIKTGSCTSLYHCSAPVFSPSEHYLFYVADVISNEQYGMVMTLTGKLVAQSRWRALRIIREKWSLLVARMGRPDFSSANDPDLDALVKVALKREERTPGWLKSADLWADHIAHRGHWLNQLWGEDVLAGWCESHTFTNAPGGQRGIRIWYTWSRKKGLRIAHLAVGGINQFAEEVPTGEDRRALVF